MTTKEDLIKHLKEKVSIILKNPTGWGDPFAVENQLLLLREILVYGEKGVVPDTRLWCEIMHNAGYESCLPLAHQKDLRDNQKFAFEELQRLAPQLFEQ